MNIDKLASLGALAVVGGMAVLWIAINWLVTPTAFAGVTGATGGVDSITSMVLRICTLIPVLVFMGSHYAFFRQIKKGPTSLNESAI